MDPQDVAKSYDQIAHHWDGDGFSRDNGIAQHERTISFTDLREPALDIGCGSSGRVIDLLAEHGFAPEGLDIPTRMLELARRRHPNVPFHHADICEWQFPHTYDFISAWDSIWHVPLPAQELVLHKILEGLSAGTWSTISIRSCTCTSSVSGAPPTANEVTLCSPGDQS
ncbi:MAG: class I SAM-dependent methyltransferase [Gammaproteobacteria bacterium]|nr:class I SAM-dependent methyltransferase [Gammaproteobacteria bacterium]